MILSKIPTWGLWVYASLLVAYSRKNDCMYIRIEEGRGYTSFEARILLRVVRRWKYQKSWELDGSWWPFLRLPFYLNVKSKKRPCLKKLKAWQVENHKMFLTSLCQTINRLKVFSGSCSFFSLFKILYSFDYNIPTIKTVSENIQFLYYVLH